MQKYKSKYSPGKEVTIAQYITELICEKKASLNGRDLPIFFWKLPEWEKFYKSQIYSAYGLVRSYDAKVLIKVLNSPDSRYQFSLRSPKLLKLFKQAQGEIDRNKEKEEDKTVEEVVCVIESPRPPAPQKSNTLNKLRNI